MLPGRFMPKVGPDPLHDDQDKEMVTKNGYLRSLWWSGTGGGEEGVKTRNTSPSFLCQNFSGANLWREVPGNRDRLQVTSPVSLVECDREKSLWTAHLPPPSSRPRPAWPAPARHGGRWPCPPTPSRQPPLPHTPPATPAPGPSDMTYTMGTVHTALAYAGTAVLGVKPSSKMNRCRRQPPSDPHRDAERWGECQPETATAHPPRGVNVREKHM